MKRIGIASTVLCFLLFAALSYASPRPQEEPKSKDKEASPAMQNPEKKPEAKPETPERKSDEMKPEKNGQERKDAKEQEKENKDQEKQGKKEEKNNGKEMGNMRNQNEAHARPAGKSAHIPDEKFKSNFGKSHTFHPTRPTVVNGQPTFAYGGYTFVMLDPWPSDWAYTDDCYIDYVDGDYFLFDLLHPGMRVALFVGM